MPISVKILCREAVFHRISAMKQIPTVVPQTYFPNGAWVSASGGFGIVSHSLVLNAANAYRAKT